MGGYVRFVLLGAPGVGKGTQADFLSAKYHIPKIATGDMLRSATSEETPLAEQIRAIMRSGELVSDDIMIDLVKARIAKPDCQNGFLLDGFPRTIAQAEALTKNQIPLDWVLEIKVGDEEIVKRLSGRLIHPASGRIYHQIYNPPKVPFKDDETGEPLLQREDDKEETVRKRLKIYDEETQPVVDYYRALSKIENPIGNLPTPKFLSVSGLGTVEEVSDRILNVLVPTMC